MLSKKYFTVHPRLFALLALSFVLATIVGTVSHELGHYTVSKCYGYSPELHYASVSFGEAPYKYEVFDSLYKADEKKILAKETSPEKEYFLNYRNELGKTIGSHRLITRIAGPMQTMITGSLGLLWLWYYRKRIQAKTELAVEDWFAVLVAFFWSRQLFNGLTCLYQYIYYGKVHKGGDEDWISRYFRLPYTTVNIVTALIALALLTWVVFYIIPKQQGFTFVIAGLAGSALGFVVWMLWLGPVMLP